jgi:hypothetical protein
VTKQALTALPTAPSRATPGTFESLTDPWLSALADVPTEVNALVDYIEDQAETASALTWWVDGTAYTAGDVVFDPADGGTYRAKTSHTAAGTNPNADSTNWQSAGGLAAADATKLGHITINEAVNLDQIIGGKTFTADGAISAGETVVLKSTGKVAGVTESTTTFALDSESEVYSGTISSFTTTQQVCFLGSGKYLFLYEAGSVVKGKVGTYDGVSWTYGTEATLLSRNVSDIYCEFDAVAGHGVILVLASNIAYAKAFTVSGTTVTTGSELTVANPGGTSSTTVSCVVGNGYAAFVYDATGIKVVCCTISGTTLGTLGSPITLDGTNVGANHKIAYLGSDMFAVNWSENTTEDGGLSLISRSGTTLTLEDTQEIYNGTTDVFTPTTSVGLIAPGKIAVAYHNNGTSSARIVIVEYSGSSFTGIGTPLNIGFPLNYSHHRIEVKNTGDKFYLCGCNGSTYPVVVELSLSGTTITLEQTTVIESSVNFVNGVAFDVENSVGVVAIYNSSDTDLVSRAFTLASTTTDADDWIGIAQEAAVDAATLKIAGLGDIATGLSGLTIDTTYYVDDDGSLTSDSAGGRLIGKAISATELLVERGNA